MTDLKVIYELKIDPSKISYYEGNDSSFEMVIDGVHLVYNLSDYNDNELDGLESFISLHTPHLKTIKGKYE